MRYYIYKYVVDNKIIYIGKTKRRLCERIDEHAREIKFLKYLSKAKIYWFACEFQLEMDLAERILIVRYKPELNIIDNIDVDLKSIQYQEPIWYAYESWRDVDDSPDIKCFDDPQDNMIDALEQQDILWQNFESLLEYWFELYTQLEHVHNIFEYSWDLDLYPLPESVKIKHIHKTYSCYSRAVKTGMSYTCVISTQAMLDLLRYGKEASRDARMAITTKRLESLKLK